MGPLVMKFGGASVASAEKFSEVADIVIEKLSENPSIVLVVSAMGKTTDELFSLARAVHPQPPSREQDMLVSAGERISIALLAMALHRKGLEAISFTGSQSGIITTSDHTQAKIIEVRPHRIQKALRMGKIVIVAGFQGVSLEGEITTLGRGGSDTSAVAIAVALGAEAVEFYKDVAGVYSEDPKKNPEAQFFQKMNYEEALKITGQGAKILHERSVALAQKNQMPLKILSFCKPVRQKQSGTWIGEKSSPHQPIKIYEN